MGNGVFWGLRLVAAAMLLLGQGLVSGSREAQAQESLKQVTDTTDGFSYTYPSVSADDPRIAFWSPGQNAIYVANSDGTGFRRLVGGTLAAWGPPSISADGQWIAFYAAPYSKAGWGDIYTMRTDGTGLRLLNPSLHENYQRGRGNGNPAISGDGTRVAFPAYFNVDGGNPDRSLEIFTVKTDGTGLRQLISSSGRSGFPSLSYDGSRIAFTNSNPYVWGHGVYIVNADGSELTRLTTTPGDRRSGLEGVARSADGSQVAFSSSADLLGKNDDGNDEIYVRRLVSLLPVQGVRNQRLAADLEKNRFSLVARRDLVVRAFFDPGVGGTSTSIRGRMIVDEGSPREATLEVTNYVARPLGYFEQDPEGRQRLEDSLNFFITGQRADDLLTPGTHSFKVIVERGLDIFSGGLGAPGAPASGRQAGAGQVPRGAEGFTPWEETFQAPFSFTVPLPEGVSSMIVLTGATP